MSDHLPECPHSEPDLNPGFLVMCICDRLRACEHRVRLHAALSWEQGFEEGRTAGLDAAREAIAALYDRHDASCDDPRCEGPDREFALAAIDALRGES